MSALRLNDWAVVSVPDNPYQAPELWSHRLTGMVIDHPRLGTPDEGITTSTIEGKRNGNIVTVSGSEYELGDVDPEYERLYPDAKTRLLASLKEVS